MGTAAVWEPEVLAAAVAGAGPDVVMASIDVSDGRARGAGWRDGGQVLTDVVAGVLAAGVRRCLVTAVARDGTMQGPDLALLAEVQRLAPDLAVLAAGGIGRLDDVRALAGAGVEGAVIGRALYEGVFTLRDALAVVAGGG